MTRQIGVSYNMSNVSLYVVDLMRASPFNGIPMAEGMFQRPSATASAADAPADLDPGTRAMRRSFVKDKTRPQVKTEETNSDPNSGTDPEDSDVGGRINDVANYQNIFRPRRRELNRTPPPPDSASADLESSTQPLSFNEPFQAPLSGSESEQNLAR